MWVTEYMQVSMLVNIMLIDTCIGSVTPLDSMEGLGTVGVGMRLV